MISALKMIGRQDRRFVGDPRSMTLSAPSAGIESRRTIAGRMAKYLATSLAMREGRQRPARHEELLAQPDDLR